MNECGWSAFDFESGAKKLGGMRVGLFETRVELRSSDLPASTGGERFRASCQDPLPVRAPLGLRRSTAVEAWIAALFEAWAPCF